MVANFFHIQDGISLEISTCWHTGLWTDFLRFWLLEKSSARCSFSSHEADLIKGIPLSVQLPEDKLIWAGNKNGKFSVRSAYRLPMEGTWSNTGSNSNDRQLRGFWRFVWLIPIPHKVRHFTWRACRNILPTKENLMHRKVLQEDWCEECKAESKTTGHLFWICPRA